MNPYEIFRLFLSDEIVHHVVEHSIIYAQQKNNHSFVLSKDDIYKFVGITILTGYHSLPQQQLYWSKAEDVSVPIVSKCMSRNRFNEIKRFLHCCDNTKLDTKDKMAKVRPLLDLINKSLLQFGVFAEALSVDEQMLPYFGKHSAKMFIRNKPIKFGYKYWALCSKDGYPFQLDIYCGKTPAQSPSEGFLGTQVVRKLLNESGIEHPHQHTVTFDNFFTSVELLTELQGMGYRATGTLRSNRTKKCPLQNVSKEPRGSFDYRTNGNIVIVQWNDNRAVHVASNFDTVHPLQQQKRYSQSEKRHIQVSQPKMIAMYNSTMGGVDLCDRFLSDYRPTVRAKRWYFPHIVHFFNVLCVAAWRTSCAVHPNNKWTHLEFRRYVARSLITSKLLCMQPCTGYCISTIGKNAVLSYF